MSKITVLDNYLKKEDYVNMFVSKDVLAPQAQQPQQRRG